jgi:DNA replication protein DnaC
MTMSQETPIPAIVAPQVLLNNHLEALKLPTFAREDEKVAMESAGDRADYPRYLLRLCELERIDRERRNVERRIRLARFPQNQELRYVRLRRPAVAEQGAGSGTDAAREWIERRQNCIASDHPEPEKRTPPWGWAERQR